MLQNIESRLIIAVSEMHLGPCAINVGKFIQMLKGQLRGLVVNEIGIL
jgi:hypothetical protein